MTTTAVHTDGTTGPRLRRLGEALRRVPRRLAWDYRLLRARLHERPHHRRFARFYETLPRHDRPLYVFFTSGLLHFVCKTLDFVPADANVVLIGSALTSAEQEFVRTALGRPFHHIETYVDDRVVWELLFAVNREPFGWLDADCFVQAPSLLRELFDFDDRTAMTCVWSYRTHRGHRMLCTHLVAVSARVLAAVRATGLPVSPGTYCFEPTRRSAYRHSYARRPTGSHVRAMRAFLPSGERGLPKYPSDIPEKGHLAYFDTLTLYQLCAESLGYRLRAVRDLQGVNSLDGHYSDDVIHINAASYYRGFKTSANPAHRQYYRMLLPFDYLLLRSMAPRLPAEYRQHLAVREADLDDASLPRTGHGPAVRQFFIGHGVGSPVFARPEWRFLDEEGA